MVSFEIVDNDMAFSNSFNQPKIAAFWANISKVDIFYKEITCNQSNAFERQRFLESKRKIMDLLKLGFGCSLKSFDLTHILLITWQNASKTTMRVSYSQDY